MSLQQRGHCLLAPGLAEVPIGHEQRMPRLLYCLPVAVEAVDGPPQGAGEVRGEGEPTRHALVPVQARGDRLGELVEGLAADDVRARCTAASR